MASVVFKATIEVKDNDRLKLAHVPGLPGGPDPHRDLCSWPAPGVVTAGT